MRSPHALLRADRFSKGITLSVLLSYSVVKEPTLARKGGHSAAALRPCQAGCFRRSEPIPADPDQVTHCLVFRVFGKNCLVLQEPRILRFCLSPVNRAPGIVITFSAPSLFQPALIRTDPLLQYSREPIPRLSYSYEHAQIVVHAGVTVGFSKNGGRLRDPA